MKTTYIFLCLFSILFFEGCSPDKEIIKENLLLPTVETITQNNLQTNVYDTKVLGLEGRIITDGGKPITEVGFCYSLTGNPNISGPHVSANATGQTSDYFSVNLDNLIEKSTYNARAYATNADGTGYGNMITFVTESTNPVFTVSQLKSVAATSAVIETITTNGNHIDEKGICYSTSPTPTISNNVVNTQISGIYLMKNLLPSTNYYVRGYAKSFGQVAYSQSQAFTTLAAGTSQQGEVSICDGIQTTTVVPITSITGKVWMDRNLGSSKPEDNLWGGDFGGFYQWGRGNDGHASVVVNLISGGSSSVNGTTNIRSYTDTPNNSYTILDNTVYTNATPSYVDGYIMYLLRDWRITPNDNLWQGLNGINNPCPQGYRLPTLAELEAEMNAYNITDHISAFSSPFKFPVRTGVLYLTSTIVNSYNCGNFDNNGICRGFWTIEISPYARISVKKGRDSSGCIRCIKD